MKTETLGIILSIVSGIAGGTVVMAGMFLKVGRKMQVLDDIKSDTGEMKKSISTINNRCFKLESATVELQTVLTGRGRKFSQKLEVAPGSPLKITPYGEELAKQIDAYNFVEEHKDFFFSSIENKTPLTAYDVQTVARSILDEALSNPIMNKPKSFAYENGMNIDVLLNILGVILRDKYLLSHPGIK